jgi:hypothetical protein
MTATVTKREIRSGVNGHAPSLESPPARTRVRARVPVTERVGKISGGVKTIGVKLRLTGRRWWAWTSRPLSLRAAWTLSAVDEKRIPLRLGTLGTLWRLSNATDRLLMFAVILAAPTVLTGPLRWIAARPTRRFGFYALTAAFAVFALIGRYAGKE